MVANKIKSGILVPVAVSNHTKFIDQYGVMNVMNHRSLKLFKVSFAASCHRPSHRLITFVKLFQFSADLNSLSQQSHILGPIAISYYTSRSTNIFGSLAGANGVQSYILVCMRKVSALSAHYFVNAL